jgi:parallel beta-helix repeat protein
VHHVTIRCLNRGSSLLRKIVSCVVLVLLVTGMLMVALKIQTVRAEGTFVTINADGGISPPTAPIKTFDNVTYVLVDNVNESIIVQRSNIVMDGNGYTLTPASEDNCAFNLTNVDNVTITNTTLTTLPYSVTLNDQNIPGFLLVNTNDSELISNNIAGDWMNNPYKYAISLTSCFGINISNNIVTGTTIGIDLTSSDNNVVFNNHLGQGAFDGIGLYSSNNNTLNKNYVSDYAQIGDSGLGEWGAFEMDSSDNNTLVSNDITGNAQGIQLVDSDNNVLTANNVTQNVGGYTPGGQYPTIGFGIHIESSSNNTIYHNNFIGNARYGFNNNDEWATEPNNAEVDNSPNKWDNGYPSGGNYWSDYNGTNTPYVINANNTDHYPLTVPYVPEFPSIIVFALFLFATLLTTAIYKKKAKEHARASFCFFVKTFLKNRSSSQIRNNTNPTIRAKSTIVEPKTTL